MKTAHEHRRQQVALSSAPSSAWVKRLAEWVDESPRVESADLARELQFVARSLEPGARSNVALPSPRWLDALADWVERDGRPQGLELARQLRDWAGPVITLD